MGRTSSSLDPERGGRREPAIRDKVILDAYVRHPSAAAVSRELDIDERTVRRKVDKYQAYLEQRLRERDEEARARIDERRARLLEWVSTAQSDNLDCLDRLILDPDPSVRLRAVRERQHIIDTVTAAFSSGSSVVDAALMAKEREAAGRIHAVHLSETSDAEPPEQDE